MKRSRRALWILMATLAAALLAVDFSTRRDDVARRPPAAARNADKRSGAKRRVITGSLARLARDPSHSTGQHLARLLNWPSPTGGIWSDSYASLSADTRHSTGAEWAVGINQEQGRQLEPDHRRLADLGRRMAAREHLNAARMGWSGCSAYASGCDHLGRRAGEDQAMRSSGRAL